MMENYKTYTESQMHEANVILEGVDRNNGRTNIVCLGQTEQSKGVMFVLYTYVDEMHGGMSNPMQFMGNLSNDLVKACKKARKICGDSNILLETELNIEQTSIKMQVEAFHKKNPEMIPMWESKNYVVQDIKSYLERKGRISHAQIDVVKRIYNKELVWAEQKKIQQQNEEKYGHLVAHYFNEKDRVELTIKDVVSTVSYESEWGRNSIIKYLTECDKVVIYSGTSPKEIGAGSKIKATIKHNVYNGANQTLLQRIAVIK